MRNKNKPEVWWCMFDKNNNMLLEWTTAYSKEVSKQKLCMILGREWEQIKHSFKAVKIEVRRVE